MDSNDYLFTENDENDIEDSCNLEYDNIALQQSQKFQH